MQDKKEAEKQMTKKGKQQLLDFKIVKGPCEFTRTGILHAVTKLIATVRQGLEWNSDELQLPYVQ